LREPILHFLLLALLLFGTKVFDRINDQPNCLKIIYLLCRHNDYLSYYCTYSTTWHSETNCFFATGTGFSRRKSQNIIDDRKFEDEF